MQQGLSSVILTPDDIKNIKADFSVLKLIDEKSANDAQFLVFKKEGNILHALTTNNFPDRIKVLVDKLNLQGYQVKIFYTDAPGFHQAMQRYQDYKNFLIQQQQQQKQQNSAIGNSAIDMIKELYEKRLGIDPGEFLVRLIRLAFQTGASDLHFQPEEKEVLMRLRLDGILHTILKFDIQDFVKYLQKLKFISGVKMNIDYLPQDGRFSFKAVSADKERTIDARVSFMPGVKLEGVVIRFLDSSQAIRSFSDLGFLPHNYEILKEAISKTTGMNLVTGPTGSGKTTTLYSILSYLNTGEKKIITLEDPVEYILPGVEQSQINPSKGYTYELGLKAVLRHDPDIILVGEIRTVDTADISLNAALTGHLVFSTLHTNNSIEAVSRLLNMGVKNYILAPALNIIIAQRLVRKICPYCKTRRKATYYEDKQIQEAIKSIKQKNPKIELNYDGTVIDVGKCGKCNGTGYQGRVAIIEILKVSEEIKKLIFSGASVSEIYGKAIEEGFISMFEDGIIKVLQGLTTLDEIRRVVS